METTLVVMAAGMGSRFGGLKQAEPITEDGKGILDFSVYDAKRAGFSRVVFIIREDMAEDFRALVGDRIAKSIPVDYVMQDTSLLPAGRKKPFGTGHAIYCCRDVVKGPFAIINADDYYGANAFDEMQRHLATAKAGEFAMTAFRLGNTLSKNGTVSRGVCELEEGYLKRVTEVTGISPDGSCEREGARVTLAADTPVSMNLWGLTPDIFPLLEAEFAAFLKHADLLKDELYIPSVISRALEAGRATVKVLQSADKWYGITYREDLAEIKEAIGAYLREGLYEGI
ncbi:MAG: nucleotidyltransferase [Clostridia bacterium]|nr:nucleotidyltransferase [Clostridia bacterium]MBQ5612361.1 nucleotidyltransferase [Clostridia bacterium]